MIIQGVTLKGSTVYDGSIPVFGTDMLLYLDANNSTSYPGSGTTWYDLSGNANHTTGAVGTTYTNSANEGEYFDFNGSGYFTTASAKYNRTYSGKTVFVAAKSASALSVNTFRCLFGSFGANRNFNLYLHRDLSGNYKLHFSAGGLGGFSNTIAYTPGDWATFAATHTTGGLVSYYFNGQLVGTNTGITFNQYLSSTSENVGASDNNWFGGISTVLVYASALSAQQIANCHTNASAYFPTYIRSNLVLYYDPSKTASYPGTGTTITDLSGNSLNGTMSNISYTSPYFAYNGSNSQVNITDNALLEPGSGNWTMEAWVYQINTGNDVILGKFDPGGGSIDVSYSIRTSGNVVYAQLGDGAGSYINSTNYTLPSTTWKQIVYVYKTGATKTLETYVNGASIGSVNHSLSSILNTPANLYLGSYNGGEYAQWFDGRIGVTRLYNAALTSADVLQNYTATKSIYGL